MTDGITLRGREYEVIEHPALSDVKMFLVDIQYRNMHMHREFELFQVIEGRMEINSRGATHIIGEGEFCLLNPRQGHEMHSVLAGPVRIMPLQVAPNFWARPYPQLSNVEFDTLAITESLGDSLETVRQHYFEAGRAYLLQEPYYELTCSAQINLIMKLLLERVPWHYLTENEKEQKKGLSTRIGRIIQHIETNYTQKLLLKDICAEEGLSLHYMSHYFSKHFNMSFQEYVKLLRFQRAKLLAERTDMKLTDIALSSGFSDIRYLNSAFQEFLGMGLADYRAQLNGQRPRRPLPQSGDAVQHFLSDQETRAFFEKRMK